jgi:hypothetical protein
MKRPSIIVYNLDNFRPAGQVERELRAIAGVWRPKRIVIIETIGNQLPELAGYWLLWDRSRPGRENLAVYVRKRIGRRRPRTRYVDLEATWSNTERPGTHWPRSILIVSGVVQLVVWHAPPKGTDNVLASQLEGVHALVPIVAPWRRPGRARMTAAARKVAELRPRVLAGDFNRTTLEDGPGPAVIRDQAGMKVAGVGIDLLLYRGGLNVTGWHNVQRAGDVELRSDHKHALVAYVQLWKRFSW